MLNGNSVLFGVTHTRDTTNFVETPKNEMNHMGQSNTRVTIKFDNFS